MTAHFQAVYSFLGEGLPAALPGTAVVGASRPVPAHPSTG